MQNPYVRKVGEPDTRREVIRVQNAPILVEENPI